MGTATLSSHTIRLRAFLGRMVNDLGGALRTGMRIIDESWGFYAPPFDDPLRYAGLITEAEADPRCQQGWEASRDALANRFIRCEEPPFAPTEEASLACSRGALELVLASFLWDSRTDASFPIWHRHFRSTLRQ